MELILSIALSAHLGFEGAYNHVHPHLRLQYERLIVGAYYNSERTMSLYGGVELKMSKDANIEFGIVTGYSDLEISPFLRGTYKDLYFAPGIENGKITGAVAGYEFKF